MEKNILHFVSFVGILILFSGLFMEKENNVYAAAGGFGFLIAAAGVWILRFGITWR